MSAPRNLLPGATYLVTRRCTQRQFLLRPTAQTKQAFLYCLAVAAERTGVEIHGVVQMSNHWHGVLTDPNARLPEFLHLLHRLVANCLNAALGRRENFWASGQTSVVTLDTPDDVLDKLAYVTGNPATAGLVKMPSEWPGVITTCLAEIHVANRPESYFRKQGSMPPVAKLVCTLPKMLRYLGREAAARRLRVLVTQVVRRARNALGAAGRKFVGADAAREMDTARTAVTPESARRRKPTFAARDRLVRTAALSRLRAFRWAYRIALDRWTKGDRTVRFPEGTYLMRVFHGARCGPPPLG